MDFQTNVDSLLRELKARRTLPRKMDVTQVGDRYWFVSHDSESDSIISETSFAGFSDIPAVAMLKSLSERMERLAFGEGFLNGNEACQTDRSDGFAAYPRFYQDALRKVREAALSEAIERYVWSKWWDDFSYNHEIYDISTTSNDERVVRYISEIKERCFVKNIKVIAPMIKNAVNFHVFIVVGFLDKGGFVSGGACGLNGFEVETSLRALDELFRHGLAIQKMKKSSLTPNSFYEKRLAFFGEGLGDELVISRLQNNGDKKIILPDLLHDTEVPHKNSDLFVVHRCLFKGQPSFMGGAIERFCI